MKDEDTNSIKSQLRPLNNRLDDLTPNRNPIEKTTQSTKSPLLIPLRKRKKIICCAEGFYGVL